MRRYRYQALLVGIAVLSLQTSTARSDDWPQFRGPHANGVATEGTPPSEWDSETNVAWKVSIPGRAWSAPIVWNDKVFVTTAVEIYEGGRKHDGGNRDPIKLRCELHCLDLGTGSTLWQKVAKETKPSITTHYENTFASETPATDGERVIAYFGMTGIFCYGLEGNLIWEKDLGTFQIYGNWGTASSPVIYGDHVFVQVDSEQDSFLLALNKRTGEQVWRIPRDEGSGWASPIIWKNSHRTELVVGGLTTRSHDPETGDLLWQLEMIGGRSHSSPTAMGDLLVVGNEERANKGAGTGGIFAVRAGASGDITLPRGKLSNEGVVWAHPADGTEVSSPLIHAGFVYILTRHGGIVTCYDAESGEKIYRKRLPGSRAFWASPLAYDGKVFFPDDTGTTHVLSPGREFKLLGANKISDRFWASSAIAGNSLLLRGEKALYCIRKQD